tara:strand:+ start:1224 stop:1868 length:645 start_codon:yes stop_codon:yes gene_type:complete
MTKQQFLDHVKDIIDKDDPIFVEIGANVGLDTRRFLDTFSGIKLFCFEPDPRCFQKLQKRIVDKRCIMYEAAISDTDGFADLYLSSGNKSGKKHKSDHINSSSLRKPKKHLIRFPWCKFDKNVLVKTYKLDTWNGGQGFEKIDFIWADTQGHEESVIDGAAKTLEITRYLYTEYNDTELYERQINLDKILSMMPSFEVAEKFKTNVLLKNAKYD